MMNGVFCLGGKFLTSYWPGIIQVGCELFVSKYDTDVGF